MFDEATPRRVDNDPPTEYLPTFGQLLGLTPPAPVPDLDEERAATLRAAMDGQRPDDEHLALLDRVLRALHRL